MSETTNLKLFKHDNPSTNTNPFDVEQALNENWDKIDTAVGDLQDDVEENNTNIDTRLTELETDLGTAKTNITNIQAEQTTQNNNIETNSTAIETNAEAIEKNKEDIQSLQEENANLRAQIPTGTAVGEEISLQDSAKMELVDFGLEGNSKQETRSGKNEIFVSDGNIQDSGINIIKKDGIITVSGTATKSIQNCYVSVKRTFTENYILSSNVSGTTNGLHIKVAYKKGEENLQYPDIDTSLKLNANDYLDQVYLIVDAGATINATIKLQLEKGEIATTFEEYGAKPSLDYPSEVEAVGDNINLYPYENVEFKSDATQEQWCYLDGQLGAYGNTVTDKTDYKIILEKGKYYFKLETADSNITTGGLVANGESSEKQLTLFDNAFEITETTVCTLRLKVANPSLGINIKSIKLEKGTVSTPYSQYGQGSIEIVKSNKNILDLGQRTGNGITFNKNKITILNPSNYLYAINTNLLNDRRLMGKTITLTLIANGKVETNNLSFNIGTNKNAYRFQKYYTVGNYNNDIYTLTRTLQSDEVIGGILIYVDGNALPTCNLEINVQIEIADEATEFVENEVNTYTIPIQKPFYKIGNYADSFIKQNGKWYEQHFIKELILTGEENWLKGSNLYPTYHIIVSDTINELSGEEELGLCNYFKIYKTVFGVDVVGLEFFNIYTSQFSFRINLGSGSEITTVEVWKAKVQELYNAGTPIKLYYVLETPELIECTEEQTQILEQIIKDGTYKEVTHFYTTEDLKPTMQVKYYKDLETLFNKQAELESTLNNVQAQLLELGGN